MNLLLCLWIYFHFIFFLYLHYLFYIFLYIHRVIAIFLHLFINGLLPLVIHLYMNLLLYLWIYFHFLIFSIYFYIIYFIYFYSYRFTAIFLHLFIGIQKWTKSEFCFIFATFKFAYDVKINGGGHIHWIKMLIKILLHTVYLQFSNRRHILVTHTWTEKYILVCIVFLLLPVFGITVVVFRGTFSFNKPFSLRQTIWKQNI